MAGGPPDFPRGAEGLMSENETSTHDQVDQPGDTRPWAAGPLKKAQV